MPRLTDTVRGVLGDFWNAIVPLAYGGASATETVTFASDFANAAGGSLSFQESQAVAVLYGYARRMSNAADVVQGLPDESPIIPDAISTPPWARDEQEQAALPMWHVHFDFTYIDAAGNQITDRRVSVFRMTLPDTMGELRDAVSADAQAMALKYNVDFVSADVAEIHSV